MSQSEISKATAADARSESARSFVRTVKAATRRKYPPEERIRIVLEGFRREVPVNDLCRREGIKPHSYYAWTKEFMEAGKERLTRDTVRNATQQEIEQFKRENGELKQVICRSLAAGTPSQKNGYPDAGRLHRYQRMSGGEKAAVLARVGLSSDPIRQVLRDLGVPKSTYYRWLRRQRCVRVWRTGQEAARPPGTGSGHRRSKWS